MIESRVAARANHSCELCGSENKLTVYSVPMSPTDDEDSGIYVCDKCRLQLTEGEGLDTHHWHCLNEAVWSSVPAVQVVAWRMLKRLNSEPWAQDLLDMVYLDEATEAWAKAEASILHHSPTVDSNGTVLSQGDTVHLIKDLNVKGASFTAKRGTAVRNIALSDNPDHIEGKVNGTRIVIIAAYTKKA
ncbi:PhnA domain-containing protein [Alteromonas ponticola]|uniref:PhnA domain-containing protein n=1 Tax=Alteromonas aquimaris TaxID=2998417 RepID=A0ABT3P907_9ALTE|nr:PhnA domain-containing protein [Alteromonas aquimaris]MCW8109204.1 PhnA domain-containing protein [Alteromonas aquimaris]